MLVVYYIFHHRIEHIKYVDGRKWWANNRSMDHGNYSCGADDVWSHVHHSLESIECNNQKSLFEREWNAECSYGGGSNRTISSVGNKILYILIWENARGKNLFFFLFCYYSNRAPIVVMPWTIYIIIHYYIRAFAVELLNNSWDRMSGNWNAFCTPQQLHAFHKTQTKLSIHKSLVEICLFSFRCGGCEMCRCQMHILLKFKWPDMNYCPLVIYIRACVRWWKYILTCHQRTRPNGIIPIQRTYRGEPIHLDCSQENINIRSYQIGLKSV